MTRDLRQVAAALLCWGIGESLFFYIQPLYLQQLGADPVQIGLILGMAAAVLAVTHIPAGALADRIGTRRLMVAGWMTGVLAAGLMFAARSLPVFVIGLLTYSFTGFVLAPMNRYVSAVRGPWSMARALSTVSAMFNMGGILGAPLGGFIGDRWGLRSIYAVSILMFIVSTWIIARTHHQPVQLGHDKPGFRSLLKNGVLNRFLGLVFLAFFGMYLSWPLTPNYLQNVRNVPIRAIGIFGSFNSVGMVLFNLSLGRLAPRLGMMLAQTTVLISALFLWLGTGLPWFAIGYFLAGGFRAARALVIDYVEGLVPASQLGVSYGLVETVSGLVQVSAPLFAGPLYQTIPALPFPISLSILGISLILTARLTPVLRTHPATGKAEPIPESWRS